VRSMNLIRQGRRTTKLYSVNPLTMELKYTNQESPDDFDRFHSLKYLKYHGLSRGILTLYNVEWRDEKKRNYHCKRISFAIRYWKLFSAKLCDDSPDHPSKFGLLHLA
jgi:hypothetical protein